MAAASLAGSCRLPNQDWTRQGLAENPQSPGYETSSDDLS
jgi:hypothetical protein